MIAEATITPQHQRPVPMPFDFVGTRKYFERSKVIARREGVALIVVPGGPGHGGVSRSTAQPVFFIFVMTQFGDMRLDVSKKVFDLLRRGDDIVIQYQRGRWTGALKGKIAR
jgi:hypothetical protein